MTLGSVLATNLLSPVILAFALGVVARLIKSEFRLPKDLYASLSIYLLFALGIKGGVELSHVSPGQFAGPAGVTLLLGCLTPITSYAVLRRIGRFDPANSAAIAAHYGSVSAVTFIAAQTFVTAMGEKPEGYMPTLLTLLESPGIHIALAIGVLKTGPGRPVRETLHEVLTGRTMILLVGGLVVGLLMGEAQWHAVQPFFEGGFKGALTLLLLEMGILAADRIGDLKKVGLFLGAFGIVMPLAHGALGVALGVYAGLSAGGATMLGAMAASASYIAAPPAARMSLPTANPTFYLTAALAITFPFNVVAGIPIYYAIARAIHGG
ncbi:MAG TPA: sodium-dependent bicarbonate transport family permease [Thermoanaerobaculia bacterium]|nr:sodium-dependent bicarbonate transport family permease [Thermoanaerobaculia bacterium]HQR66048.1 sodium-dependent bicarbonate transport family permease [Thermoanaerobaculia bacterium]